MKTTVCKYAINDAESRNSTFLKILRDGMMTIAAKR